MFIHKLLLSFSSFSFFCKVKTWDGISGILICSQLYKLTLSHFVHTLTCCDTRRDCDTPVFVACVLWIFGWLFVVFRFCAPAWEDFLAVKQGYGLLPKNFNSFGYMKCKVMPPSTLNVITLWFYCILHLIHFPTRLKKQKTNHCPCLTLFLNFFFFCRQRRVT